MVEMANTVHALSDTRVRLRGGVRVLVADDDESIRDALRSGLEDEGYNVVEAPDGEAALERLRHARQPMVVIADQVMPRLDGPGLLRAVIAEPGLAERHAFIGMTASGPTTVPEFMRLLEAVRAPIILKPFTLDMILDAAADAASRLPCPGDIRDATVDVPTAGGRRPREPAVRHRGRYVTRL